MCVTCHLPKLDIFFRVNNDYDVVLVSWFHSFLPLPWPTKYNNFLQKFCASIQSLPLLLTENTISKEFVDKEKVAESNKVKRTTLLLLLLCSFEMSPHNQTIGTSIREERKTFGLKT